jgi:hypothetical protein
MNMPIFKSGNNHVENEQLVNDTGQKYNENDE